MARTRLLLAAALATGCYDGLDADGAPPDTSPTGGSLDDDDTLDDTGGADAGTDGATDADSEDSEALEPGIEPLRRLSRTELRNTLSDLLRVNFEEQAPLPTDAVGEHGFREGATVSPVDARGLVAMAEQVGEIVTERAAELVPCDVAQRGEADCARQFITDFGLRAYRRPLTTAEVESLAELYDAARTEAELDHLPAVGAVGEAMVLSPSFLYHRELASAPAAEEDGTICLGPYEVASKLSYFLWNRMPDEALFAAAADGRLETREDLAAQVDRMLADDRARDAVADFHLQWLDLYGLEDAVKDPTAHPEVDRSLLRAMQEETARFVQAVVLDREGSVGELLTSTESFADARLAAIYGVAGPDGSGDDFGPVSLPADQRAGVLTQPSFLARHSGPFGSNPARRGVEMLEQVLCIRLASPPANIPEIEPSAGTTTREQFEQHAKDEVCAACHQTIDPLGFSLEHFDAVGAYRALDNGVAVDASGSIELDERSVDFERFVELAPALGHSAKVGRCYAAHWFRYAMGRREQEFDAQSLLELATDLAEGQEPVTHLLRALATSQGFQVRAVTPGEMIQ